MARSRILPAVATLALLIVCSGCKRAADVGPVAPMRGAERAATSPTGTQWTPLKSPARGQTWMLYLTRYGSRYQLRLRLIPYPGDERVIWERPSGIDEERYPPMWPTYMPSPSFDRVVVVYPTEMERQLYVVDLKTGEEQRAPGDFEFVYWKGDTALGMMNSGRSAEPAEEVTYDLRTRKQTTKQWPKWIGALRAAFDQPTRIATALATEGRLPIKLSEEEAVLAVLRGVGLSHGPPLTTLSRPGPNPIIAVSPDGRYAATTSGQGEVTVTRVQGPGSRPVKTIALTRLAEDEGVSVADLRWSPDSRSLTFTEGHYHPPRFYLAQPDIFPIGQRVVPDPLDTTYLVRMYVVGTDRVATIAVGSHCFLMSTPALHAPVGKKGGS
jgi:hypothetical protein